MSGLRKLAASLGVSITTVSRALDGDTDVAPATRERVRAAAAATGYRQNTAGRPVGFRPRPERVVWMDPESGQALELRA
jgi:hypothetical protein